MSSVKVLGSTKVEGTVSFTDETGYLIGEPTAISPSLSIYGKVNVTFSASSTGPAIGLHQQSVLATNSFIEIQGGSISVVHAGVSGTAYGLLSAASGARFINNGSMTVQAGLTAYGVHNDFAPLIVSNSGALRVLGGNAVAVQARGGTVENHGGSIIAEAHGPNHTAIGVSMNGTKNVLVNSGNIWGSDESATMTSIGVLLSPRAGGTASVINVGEIAGDRSLVIDPGGAGGEGASSVVNNMAGGRLTGDVVFADDSDDTFTNDGLVTGSVFLGDGVNVFNGSGGIVTGTVTGGSGVDTITMGAGNDFVAGLGGNDVLNGGSGVDVAVYDIDSSQATWIQSGGGWLVSAGALGVDVLTNIEFLKFKDKSIALTGSISDPTGADLNDLNGDGRGDLVFKNGASGQTVIWYSAPDGVYAPVALIAVTPDWTIVDSADFDGDGRCDLLWRNSAGEVVTWDSTGNFIAGRYLGAVSTDFRIEQAADFTGDGRADILWRNSGGEVTLWISQPNNTFGTAVVGAVGLEWKVIAAADFNGDGKDDVFWRDTAGNTSVWLSNGTTFSGFVPGGISSGYGVLGAGDLNFDGRDDLLLVEPEGRLLALLGQTTGFTQGIFGFAPSGWTFEQIADMDGDGRDDIVWRASNGDVMLWKSGATAAQFTTELIAPIPTEWQIF